ncbi:nematocyst expressed protein 4-like isoform X1 [Ostrinia nubilalis]|uniref:nematocyst expressed protein 4-like isoform X1 n=2 Tax=Ostrinia nubilalis TaxID=29057 RepID=UPI0030825149
MTQDFQSSFDTSTDYTEIQHWPVGIMEAVITAVFVLSIVVVLLLMLCRCCSRDRSRGQVITPPAPPGTVPAPYPQQQYSTVVTTYPVAQAPYPAAQAPYPAAQAPYPVAPYPAAPVGMPTPGAGAPYPTAMPYPHPQPQPHVAPSAPDANVFFGMAPPGWNTQALPPSYEQATGAEFKHATPYNPGY